MGPYSPAWVGTCTDMRESVLSSPPSKPVRPTVIPPCSLAHLYGAHDIRRIAGCRNGHDDVAGDEEDLELRGEHLVVAVVVRDRRQRATLSARLTARNGLDQLRVPIVRSFTK